MMSPTYGVVLYASAGIAYAFLLLLLLLSKRASHTRVILAAACATTVAWAGANAAGWGFGFGIRASLVELAGIGAWCAFLLHLLRRQAAGDLRSFQIFAGCGAALVLAVLGFSWGNPEAAALAGLSSPELGELAARLGLVIYGILLVENLYRN